MVGIAGLLALGDRYIKKKNSYSGMKNGFIGEGEEDENNGDCIRGDRIDLANDRWPVFYQGTNLPK